MELAGCEAGICVLLPQPKFSPLQVLPVFILVGLASSLRCKPIEMLALFEPGLRSSHKRLVTIPSGAPSRVLAPSNKVVGESGHEY